MENEYLNTAIQAVESSGRILTEYFERLHDFKQKNKNIRDLVTEVDILSEKNIIEKINTSYPNHNIYGEETGDLGKESEYCWHIDPIDGTVNYSQGIPICAISIGLEHNGQIIIGAIYNPFSGELFFASKGQGAFLNGQKINVSEKNKLEDGLYIAAFSSDRREIKKKEYEVFGHINDLSRGALRIGSAALALAYLSCGRIDGFWSKGLKIWDLAAGIIMVNEARGNISGNVLSTNEEELLFIASNGFIHDQLEEQLQVIK